MSTWYFHEDEIEDKEPVKFNANHITELMVKFTAWVYDQYDPNAWGVVMNPRTPQNRTIRVCIVSEDYGCMGRLTPHLSRNESFK